MLEPSSREVLLTALRPPPGCRLDRAIATTYSLDLTTLLTAPLAFSLFDSLAGRRNKGASAGELTEQVDPFALLKSVREHAERLTVFCQAGCIASPAKYRQLLTYLEGSVVQVQAPSESGVFHPKMWALRFIPEDGPVQYRVLCASRNLTFDRSWDTVLVLDGVLTDRTNAIAANHPLSDFFEALPGLKIGPMPERVKKDVSLVAEELRRVRFELPEGFDDLQFQPLGLEGYRALPFAERRERMLIVSPFVNAGGLELVRSKGTDDVLVSRMEELRLLNPAVLGPLGAIKVLSDAAEADPEEGAAPDGGGAFGPALPPPTGLHAKIFVANDGWNAHVWTGSANATTAAFKHNVEFLVQLTGKRSLVGVDAILNGPNGSGGLEAMLATFTPDDAPLVPSPAQLALDERVRKAKLDLARTAWVAVAGPPAEKLYPFVLHVRGARLALPANCEVSAWPITLHETFAQKLKSSAAGLVAEFGSVSFEALTSFFAFRLRCREGDLEADELFALNVDLEGAPEDRSARVLQSLLDDPAKVLRFLRILLAADGLEVAEALDLMDAMEGRSHTGAAAGTQGLSIDTPLLEEMLRALHRDPKRIDAVDSVVTDLSATEQGKVLLPPEFMQVWKAIRKGLASNRERR